MSKISRDRRKFLKVAGTVGGATIVAGCTGGGGGGESTDSGGGTTGTASSSGGTSSGGDDILIGYGGGLTGKWDYLEDSMGPLLNMAIEEVNAAGGPLDRTLTLSRRDTQVQVNRARQVLQQHINTDDANVLMGYNSTVLVPLWDFLQEQEVPLVTPWMGSTYKDTRGGDNGTPEDLSDDEWVWRSMVSDSISTATGAISAADRGVENFAVLNGTSAGERAWSDAYIASTKPIDQLEMVNRVEVEEGKSTYQSELSRLFQSDIDMWVLAIGLQDAQTIIREWEQGGYGVPVTLENALQQEQLLEQIKNSVGEVSAEMWMFSGNPTGPVRERVRESYTEYTDQDMIPWNYAGYDAVMSTALAIERAGSAEPDAIQRNLGPVTRPGDDKVTVTSFAEGKEELAAGNDINYDGALSKFDYSDKGNVFAPGQTYEVDVPNTSFNAAETISEEEVRSILTDQAYQDAIQG
ncbi:ABC transporter substrate-binding protein [Haloplanus halophilus]|uniref:ABC transporter substrate-binding protein n=1 Tax=Haloplanus halophilus TaxID=2949993 RepID=UPI00203A4394|nr:ABC transporter substrate-binding protein [Haloplanus sp. GDY1]